jgi:pyruvate,water dikinase
MGGFGRIFRRILPRAGARPARIGAAAKLAALREVGAANDAFLAGLARYRELANSGTVSRPGLVTDAYETLSKAVGEMVGALQVMTGGRHAALAQRFEALDRELSREVLHARPLQFGPPVAWPGEPLAIRPEVVGPKAARLAELAGDPEYNVPPFFAVTVFSFHTFMEASGAYDLVQRFLASADVTDERALDEFAHDVAATILGAPLPVQLRSAIEEAVGRLAAAAGREIAFAVRSSAVVEDAESTFAGLFESVLNVRPADVPAAYARVLASGYGAAALRYAHARGFLHDDVAMPVLVMAMVAPEASGVAYSQGQNRCDRIVVTAVPGLAQALVDGRVVPDRFVLAGGAPPLVESADRGLHPVTLRCARAGGVEEVGEAPAALSLSEATASRIAGLSRSLERRFGGPQDVEWALDTKGVLWVVQTRPLVVAPPAPEPAPLGAALARYRVLLRGGEGASFGVAAGRVAKRPDPAALGDLPAPCILVVPTTSPRLAGVMGSLAGLVAVAGSSTGHMATVAREFRVPCLVGAARAMEDLAEGELVTLDAAAGRVYEGEIPELLAAHEPSRAPRRNPVRESLQRLVQSVAPLTLTDPDSASFDAANCRTLHDVARFVHQRAMEEMFATDSLAVHERRSCRRLAWSRPMELRILDLGGGVVASAGRHVRPEDVASIPLQALLEGMLDSRLRWAGPVGFDLKGFVSVVARSAADDQRYGEPSYALCSRDYLHFASRLAYHFAVVDTICGESVNENFVRFRFQGGAAVVQRREWRGQFLAAVLRANRFAVSQTGDRIDAALAKRPAAETEDALVMLGRLMVASRQLDMVIENAGVAASLAQAFLTGDYSFERVRTGGGA